MVLNAKSGKAAEIIADILATLNFVLTRGRAMTTAKKPYHARSAAKHPVTPPNTSPARRGAVMPACKMRALAVNSQICDAARKIVTGPPEIIPEVPPVIASAVSSGSSVPL